jgi:hypothetical protein
MRRFGLGERTSIAATRDILHRTEFDEDSTPGLRMLYCSRGSQEPHPTWRVVHQHGQEVPRGVSQQEQGP